MVFLRNVNESLNTECLNLNMQSDTMILALGFFYFLFSFFLFVVNFVIY